MTTSMVLETITLNASQWSPGSSPVAISRQGTSTGTQSQDVTTKSSLSKPLGPREYERDRLVRKCVGRQVHVLNLMSLMPAWPKEIHSQEILDEVNVEVDEWLKTVNVAEAKKRKHRTKSNYAILASVFYSSCKKEKLLALTKYQYWIFWFDDEIDTGGELTTDTAGTRRICDLTLQCVEDCLHPDIAQASFVPPANSPGTVEVLYEVLGAMRPEMGPMSIERMRRELHEYVEGVARQQAVRQDEHLPDPWYHFDIRSADVGVIPSITHNEYAMDFELPDSIRYHEAIETIVMECTRLAILINEILSVQKEFFLTSVQRVGQLENMVLLIMNAENASLHEAVSRIISLIRKHYAVCEDAVARLPWTDDEVVNEHIRGP
ncbi:pentalenene synthase [Diaporthe helianthi]|uniref:Terpene synthase n=1 Tax=Diaporthe helianthi TaxID=158607 RepID=A0A2P5HV80_DIAHE|nr:pentalenene synthase [Diaporthe helianthi]